MSRLSDIITEPFAFGLKPPKIPDGKADTSLGLSRQTVGTLTVDLIDAANHLLCVVPCVTHTAEYITGDEPVEPIRKLCKCANNPKHFQPKPALAPPKDLLNDVIVRKTIDFASNTTLANIPINVYDGIDYGLNTRVSAGGSFPGINNLRNFSGNQRIPYMLSNGTTIKLDPSLRTDSFDLKSISLAPGNYDNVSVVISGYDKSQTLVASQLEVIDASKPRNILLNGFNDITSFSILTTVGVTPAVKHPSATHSAVYIGFTDINIEYSTVEPLRFTPTYTGDPSIGAPAMLTGTAASQAVSSVVSQEPDGIQWITPQMWIDAQWDGNPKDPTIMSKAELCQYAFPNANTMRGLREKFYQINPFKDVTNPTIAEIDHWNLEVIRHFRSLFGITTPVSPDRCLYLKAQWSSERKNTTIWSAKYPDGICDPVGTLANAHCGSTFLPSAEDQLPYLNGESPCTATVGGAEDLASINLNIPWSIKLARIMSGFVCNEGMTGHAGPYFGREFVGMNWTVSGNQQGYRAKWAGRNVVPVPFVN